MRSPAARLPARLSLAVLAAAWAGVVLMLLPDTVFPYDDDVGYLRSVVQTLQHGRPWTDDWLEPWAASLSVVTAGLVALTGSFTGSVEAVLVAGAGLALVPAALMFERRGMPRAVAMLGAVVLLSAPTLLWKQTQFTSLAICLPAMFVALLAADRRAWVLFLAAYAVAVTSRQSAVAWLALPAWEVLRSWLRCGADSRWKRALPELATIVAGGGLYLAADLVMNETYAQRVMTTAMWSSVDAMRLVHGCAIAMVVFALAAGCGAFLGWCARPQAAADDGAPRRWVAGVIGFGVLAAGLGLPRIAPIELELPLRELAGADAYRLGIVAIASAGWILGGWRVRWEYLAAGIFAGLLVGLRGSVWDYYLVDVAVLGIFALEQRAGRVGATRNPWLRPVAMALGLVVAGVALAQHWATALRVKRVMDGSRALTILSEHALRSGRIGGDELSVAPFGFQVWHLYPPFTRTVGADGRYIADFTGWLRPGALEVEVAGAPAGAAESVAVPDEGDIVATGVFRAMWRERHTFSLRRAAAAPPAELPLPEGGLDLQPFPLNDEEWRRLIDAGRIE